MKPTRLHLLTTTLVLALLAPLAHAQPFPVNPLWTGTYFKGTDPYYGTTVSGYKQGTTATLVLAITNTFGQYINVTGANLIMDWGTNYPTTGISSTSPVRINANTQGTVTISFTVPTSVTNIVIHSFTGNVNYTRTGIPGTQQLPFDGTNFAAYSSDQATDISLMQQLGLTTFTLSGISLCGLGGSSFKTAEGSSLCLQASQQAALGQALYSSGNFTGSKPYMQNAVSLWNQALTAENTKGASIEQGATLGGYGGLLLGIGAIIGSVAAIIYAFKRRELQRVTTPATH
ncbi:MAG TPA: hypothetical protein VNA15_03215 [Candidatus Angelobacter sp.]|nr:hypothetical protein [Candidatus Angelobacter sp.]